MGFGKQRRSTPQHRRVSVCAPVATAGAPRGKRTRVQREQLWAGRATGTRAGCERRNLRANAGRIKRSARRGVKNRPDRDMSCCYHARFLLFVRCISAALVAPRPGWTSERLNMWWLGRTAAYSRPNMHHCIKVRQAFAYYFGRSFSALKRCFGCSNAQTFQRSNVFAVPPC